MEDQHGHEKQSSVAQSVRHGLSAGVALGKCVEYGYTMAKEVAQYLDGDGTAAHIAGPQKTQDDSFYEGEVPVTSGFGAN